MWGRAIGSFQSWIPWPSGILLLFLSLSPQAAQSQVRFDVFVGYDGLVPAMGWFPVTCEVENNGPSFLATFEATSGQFGQGEIRRMKLELPTGTTKRFVIPFHVSGLYVRSFSARLLDGRGKVVAKAENLQARSMGNSWIPLSAAVGTWVPELPAAKARTYEQNSKPIVARILPDLFPDNPITLAGLKTIYLNTERALELKDSQVETLLDWMQNGGNLVVSIKQVSQLSGTEWLRKILPCQVTGMNSAKPQQFLHQWVTNQLDVHGEKLNLVYTSNSRPSQNNQSKTGQGNASDREFTNPYSQLPLDFDFEGSDMEIAVGELREGRILAGNKEWPLIVTTLQGRGQVTQLNFSPERKPFTDWTNRLHFWAKMTDLPPELLVNDNFYAQGHQSIDGVFGSIVDSRQIRRLPVGWLLLLLVTYLLVIGPVDRYWLKKINRQMLTWLTFPAYVVFFSFLIYFIGYKLRAGETEWNELHLVDILPRGNLSMLQGRTYASLYSPVNAQYEMGGNQKFAAFRQEFGGSESSHNVIEQKNDGYLASVRVPVWTSQLFVSNWWQEENPPLVAALKRSGQDITAMVENRLGVAVNQASLVFDGTIHKLGTLAPGEPRWYTLGQNGESLVGFLNKNANRFQQVINQRRNVLSSQQRLTDITNAVMASCFSLPALRNSLLLPPGLDLSPSTDQGQAVVLAWTSDYAPVDGMNRFKPRRNRRDTLWRLVVAPENDDRQ